MKKLIIMLSILFLFNMESKAQQEKQFTPALNFMSLKTTGTAIYIPGDTTGIVKDPAYYKQKSKNLRTAGLGFLGAGVLLSGIGLLVIGSNDVSSDDAGFGLAIMGLGAISGIVSIPLMVNAHVNGHKARLLLKTQKTGFGVPANVSKDITGITLTIPIGK
jgi:hypothetical protein